MKTKILACTIILSVLLSACAQQNPQALNNGGNNGLGIDSPGTSVAQDNNSNGGIDNSGNVSPAGPEGSTPGSEAGSRPGGNSSGSGTAMQWINYKDPTFGYSLTYPDIYTTLKEPQTFNNIAPDLIGRFRLLEPSLAKSDFAEMEPPKFSIEIYSNTKGLALKDWVNSSYSGEEMENVKVSGIDCIKISLKIQLAPNQFILCNHDNKIYKFTLAGNQSKEILDSFKFGGQ